jgi:hypothetical protein
MLLGGVVAETACDAACSDGVAWLLPARHAWRLRRVLTDGSLEFKGGV